MIPFVVIYFSQIVGISASIVGAGIAASGLGGIAFVMLVAGQIDRRGGHPVLLMCMSVLALATLGYPWATNVWLFLLVTVVLTFASQLTGWPSDATIASITDPSRVAEAMSILRVANAVGIGAGGFIGGALAAGGGMAEYRVVFLTSAAMVGTAAPSSGDSSQPSSCRPGPKPARTAVGRMSCPTAPSSTRWSSSSRSSSASPRSR